MPLSAAEAFAKARGGSRVMGWKLDRDEREALLRRFPPRYPYVDADHVTLRSNASKRSSLPGEREGEIVGRIDDGEGLEAMVVRIGGSIDRPGGGIYHITWSLEDKRRPKESNDLLAARLWTALAEPVPIALQPLLWARAET